MLFSRGFLFPLLSLYALRAGAVATNRTIDDTIGDSVTGSRPVYLPATVGVWEDATCSRCSVNPDQSRAFKGTWTAATYNPGLGSMSIELPFQGTAIYVFFILAGIIPGVTTETACNFTLDGQLAGTFNHTPSTASDLQYDALVYSERNLRNVDHKLIISTSADHNVFVGFDYAIYTADDTPAPSPSTSSPSPSVTNTETSTSSQTSQSNLPVKNHNLKGGTGVPIGAIVGGVVGGLVFLVALILLFLFCQRRRRRAIQIQGSEVTPHLVPFVSKGYSHSSLQLSTPYRDRHITHSDFIQSGTIAPSRSSIEVGASSTYQTSNNSPSFNGSNTPSTFLAHHRDMTNPNIVSTLPSGAIMLPAKSDQAPTFRSRPPVSPPLHGSQLDTTETTRRARQQELDRQLRAVKQEMRDLTMDIQAERTPEGSRQVRSEDVELMEMREQMRLMREQIEFLRTQQQSDWAQGLSDNPPPGYSPRSSSIRVPH
ncbi:hypothetical protein Hypma_003230 [Hypsizygus marmoreus]|uniref:Uncharacterized protein n=1 Tax=Hypsizygus marmoreus TaxID=39966 RepID=A0A369K138_HYPMA|nr:hypothetical protein Hypma_003230 [Hypsizygus marmoreus]